MSKRVSELVGMDVFDENAKRLGKVYDAIIDLQQGAVVRLALEPIHANNQTEAARLFKEKTILYNRVKAAEKILIVSKASAPESFEEPVAEAPKPATSMRYRYLRR